MRFRRGALKGFSGYKRRPCSQLSRDTPVPARVYVVFIAEVVPQTTEALIQALSNLAQNGVQEVYLGFSTPGEA